MQKWFFISKLSEFQSSEHVGQPDIIEASPTKFLNYFFNFIIYLEQQPGVPSTTVKLFGDLFKTNQCYYQCIGMQLQFPTVSAQYFPSGTKLIGVPIMMEGSHNYRRYGDPRPQIYRIFGMRVPIFTSIWGRGSPKWGVPIFM